MKIASYNVNGVNGRLSVLLRWLAAGRPDVVCLQELKCPDERFPARAIEKAGYGAIWHGQKSWNGVAILARGKAPIETRRGLPGDPDDSHSRYIEAAVDGILVGCIYLPNGNPAPGPKFDYKLRWFERLDTYAAELLKARVPAALVGDYNVMPTDLDVYAPERWRDDALFRPEVRDAYRRLVDQGWTDALRALYPGERIYTFWKYFGMRLPAMPDCGSIISCSVSTWLAGLSLLGWIAMREAGKNPATMRRSGSNLRRRIRTRPDERPRSEAILSKAAVAVRLRIWRGLASVANPPGAAPRSGGCG